VLQSVGEVAVVGEQQQTLGVGIQPADVEEPVLAIAPRKSEIDGRPNSSLIVETTPSGLLKAR
jgi:hypothetical protein